MAVIISFVPFLYLRELTEAVNVVGVTPRQEHALAKEPGRVQTLA